MSPIPAPPVSLAPLLPVLIVVGTGVLVLLLDLLPPRRAKDHLAALAVAGVVASLVTSVLRWNTDARAFNDMVVLDNYALFFDLVIGYGAGLILLLSSDYLRRMGMDVGEYYALVLFSTAGMMLLASAADRPAIRPTSRVGAFPGGLTPMSRAVWSINWR